SCSSPPAGRAGTCSRPRRSPPCSLTAALSSISSPTSAPGAVARRFPAAPLAAVLAHRGIVVDLVTDERAERYGTAFPARNLHLVASATVRRRDPFSLARTATLLGMGTVQALRLIGRIRPSAVVGFGGYPTVPPVLAATLCRIPTLIHEQNAVMGR